MAIARYETFIQKDGKEVIKVYLTDTKLYPHRYFYTSVPSPEICEMMGSTYEEVKSRVYDLLDDSKYNWWMVKRRGDEIIVGYVKPYGTRNGLHFARELYKAYLNKDIGEKDRITHINKVSFDFIDENLNVGVDSQGGLNKLSRGYVVLSSGEFHTQIGVDALNNRAEYGENYQQKTGIITGNNKVTEVEACSEQYDFELSQVRAVLGEDAYVYHILENFLGHEDILDQVRTGKITDTEAKLLLLEQKDSIDLKIKENAWYYYRFNLADFFEENNIPVPDFKTNKEGRMVHPVTNEILCPKINNE